MIEPWYILYNQLVAKFLAPIRCPKRLKSYDKQEAHAHAYTAVIERLYDLTQDELRGLAVEALLISDGPDSPYKQTK